MDRHADGNRMIYQLTPSGKELQPIVDLLGEWGLRRIPKLGDEDLDPCLLMWDMGGQVTRTGLPPGRTSVHLRFTDVAPADQAWWLVMTADDADVCDFDPGFPLSVTVATNLRCLSRIWRGDVSWREAVRAGELAVTSQQAAVRGGTWRPHSAPWVHHSVGAACAHRHADVLTDPPVRPTRATL